MKAGWRSALAVGAVMIAVANLPAQQCTTQSQMREADRAALVSAAVALANQVKANDAAAVQRATVPEVAQNFGAIANAITTVAPHLQGAGFTPQTLWLLDATGNKAGADGKFSDVQFFCNLNGGAQSTTFYLQALPQGRYGLVILDAPRAQPAAQLSLLLRESSPGTWQLGGFFPRATVAAGHDGVWYWKQARTDAMRKQSWNAWLNYEEATRLLRPVGFVSSSHLEQLQDEQTKSAPAALANGVTEATPLVVKAKDGTEYRVTGLGPDDSLSNDRIDIAMHYTAETIADPAAARARNQRAAAALLAAYPELRDSVHGVWVFAEAGNGSPYASEEPLTTLR